MVEKVFHDFVRGLCFYYERRDPREEALDLWFQGVKHIPDEPVVWMSDQIRSRHDAFPRNLMRAYRQAVKESGIAKIRFHDLRYTFASRLVQNGADLFAVQKLGRWKNTSMVMRYAHHYTENLRATIEMMDGGKKQIITNLSQSPKKRVRTPYLRVVSG
jgi:integrase